MSDIGYRLAEIERRLANVIRIGVVDEVNPALAKVRVKIGELTTGWLPWLTERAGADRTWWAPTIGEQVLVLSPSGETTAGVALPAIYRAATPAPSANPAVRKVSFADGSSVSFNNLTGDLTVDAKGDVELTAGGNVAVTAVGNVTATATGTINATSPIKITLTAPIVEVAGQLSQNGGPQVMYGNLTFVGNMTVTGNLGITGAVTVTGGDVSADGISLKNHTHSETGGTTGPAQ